MDSCSFFSWEIETEEILQQCPDEEERSRLVLANVNLYKWYLPVGRFHQQLIEDVQESQLELCKGDSYKQVLYIAQHLKFLGYHAVIHHILNSKPNGVKGPKHSFVMVSGEDDCHGVDFIVDPNFRDQFRIASPFRAYEQLLHSLPKHYISSVARLAPVIQLICNEMSFSFRQKGLSLPLWRSPAYLIQKWLPNGFKVPNLNLSKICSPHLSVSNSFDFDTLEDSCFTKVISPPLSSPIKSPDEKSPRSLLTSELASLK